VVWCVGVVCGCVVCGCVVCGVWCGVWCVVCGVWCVVCGVWCVVWCVVWCGVVRELVTCKYFANCVPFTLHSQHKLISSSPNFCIYQVYDTNPKNNGSRFKFLKKNFAPLRRSWLVSTVVFGGLPKAKGVY
jgi:hypothetical protein